MATAPAWVEATAAALRALPDDEWTVLRDVRWPGQRYANVDHVVVGPPGVFVIDTKAWAGRISVRDDVLRQNGHVREVAVAGVAAAALAISAVARSAGPGVVRPVLCFVRDEHLVASSRGVLVCSIANVVTMLRSRPVVLTPVQRGMVALELDPSGRTPPWRGRPLSVR